jgi:carboxyl-terminal processing protease
VEGIKAAVEIGNLENKRFINKWPLKKIGATLIAAFLVFVAGIGVGNGSLHARNVDSNGKVLSLPEQLDYNSVSNIYKLLKSNYDGTLDQQKLEDGLKAGLVDATGDPYTNYFDAKEAKDFNQELSGSFTGIGAELGSDNDNHIVIVSPLSGYPAEKAGLKSKDIIAAVDGQSTIGLSIDSVVKKIRGPENTSVSLTIIRGSGTPFPVSITRTKISVPSVESHIDGNIGYIKVSQFSQDTYPLVQSAAQDFKAKGVKAVVLDLRGDPGGYLESAVNISSLWLEKGKVVVSERKGGKTQNTDYATGTNTLKGIPTAVLIDGGSASASEITAGALHDNGVATLVGTKSFGKGSVQQVINLKDGSELKVTVAHWYTPDGKNINKQGISPDVQVDNSEADVKAGKDPQKDKAYEFLRDKIAGL